ncbi:MAG TPA: bidirectional hydrogenase complex protein HoxU [Acidimicrobiales bacterium]|nr:bidirectional hydrogenase complex protein HoxU [Acidimicrobiales bacterium]
MTILTLKIDGRDVAGAEGRSILAVAQENGIRIPTLCHLDGLTDVGACRLCMVQVTGTPRLLPACVTAIEEGMEVQTTSETLLSYRRQILELFFTERNHVCAVCVANRNCELQSLAAEHGVTHFDLPLLHPVAEVDASHERFVMDHNRCILCTRCVRVCAEIEGAHTWDIRGRGSGARLIADLGVPWGESDTCTSCGKCVRVCPTGALSVKGRSVAESKRTRPYIPFLVEHGRQR